jgi:hypothetical protein
MSEELHRSVSEWCSSNLCSGFHSYRRRVMLFLLKPSEGSKLQ